jgi:hypothetical protein
LVGLLRNVGQLAMSCNREAGGWCSGSTVPRGALAHIHPELADAALKMMEINMRAGV